MMATQEEYDDILRYKTAVEGRQKYRPGLTENQMWNIRDKASRYKVEQQCLHVHRVGGQRSRGPEEATSCGEAGWEGENIEDVP